MPVSAITLDRPPAAVKGFPLFGASLCERTALTPETPSLWNSQTITHRVLGMTFEIPYRPLPVDQLDVRYVHGPDSEVQPDVPVGETIAFRWEDSAVYRGTTRTFWVHVPAGYDPGEPASLMVFQDGWWYLDPAGQVRGATVLDNLVHRGEIPVTIGVFVDPGILRDAGDPKNRNVEYDAFDDRYVTFLLTEIIPQVTARWAIAEGPERWGICGGSSGGNCAFTAAWLRPDRFRRVIGYLSSFAQMPDGNPYPALIAEVPRKPLRILLQAGHRDLRWNEPERNWLAANLRVAAALAEAGYDFRLVLGEGGHNPNHGGVLLPDALRWLWREVPT
jgi:enterochelin esterase family protein